ncbi:adenosine deaminase [Vibrio hepatarius]|nr:adenosine deaminase [Vibrio hepatarius]NIY83105.1 adenosine deaminase [Vibrio hepatarius]NVJ55834.1 adenosine deaminase [Vibrionaceae bacterium]
MSKKTQKVTAKSPKKKAQEPKAPTAHETRKKIEDILAQREFDKLYEL